MPALFARVLGETFAQLPTRVRALHEREGTRTYRGVADVERDAGFLPRLFSWATSLPRAGRDVALVVTIETSADTEKWTRDFAGHRMPSRLGESNGALQEKLGLATFDFDLTIENQALVWRVGRVRALGIPLPPAWFANVVAREFDSDGRYRFDVRAQMPGIGLLVHYHGWLDVD
ncbi:MAG: DUF4166 domain-containing protein [Rudaea sp.]